MINYIMEGVSNICKKDYIIRQRKNDIFFRVCIDCIFYISNVCI